MKTIYMCLLLSVLWSCQRANNARITEKPLHRITWLKNLARQAKPWAENSGWEIYQCSYLKQEVFLIFTCTMCEERGSYVIYSRRGKVISQGKVIDVTPDKLLDYEILTRQGLLIAKM